MSGRPAHLLSAPSNIALIKYMGKSDTAANLPENASLSMTLDATSSDVDLKALNLTALNAEANASTFRLVLPASYTGDAKGRIKAAAGNVQVTVPPGAAVRIRIETKAGSRDVPSRFIQKNGGYETPEYAGAKNRLTLTISANAGRVTIV